MTIADIAAEHIETEEKMMGEECVVVGNEFVVVDKESDHVMEESGYFLGMESKKPS